MSRKLIDLNEPLRRLRDDGYYIDIHAGYLIARDIPYVNGQGKVAHDGILASTLSLNGTTVNQPDDHTIKFAGDYPCHSDGRPLDGVRQGSESLRLSERLAVNHSFSSKPPRGHYVDYYEKVNTYAAILSGHAAVLEPSATAKTRRVSAPEDEDSPFAYIDTASARAEINMVTRKLAVQKLAIVGLGGTGGYVLDLLSKTPAREIHLFDGDTFSSHNAFRAPGAASAEDLRKQPLKVDYFNDIYSRLHRGIVSHGEYVGADNAEQLRGMDFVFLCADASSEKRTVVSKLEEFGVGFIDVGMGLYLKDETLGGIVRVTTSLPENREVARGRMSFASDTHNNEYDKNIQIADLNCLNATLAVMRWKKLRGFYFDRTQERYNSFTVASNMLLNEDGPSPESG